MLNCSLINKYNEPINCIVNILIIGLNKYNLCNTLNEHGVLKIFVLELIFIYYNIIYIFIIVSITFDEVENDITSNEVYMDR